MTQFGRALAELNIEILCANSSQAKGRVERVNRTLQDRLVKELRMAEISDIEAGNAFLPGFMERFNARFAVAPARSDDLHRPLNIATRAAARRSSAGASSAMSASSSPCPTTASGSCSSGTTTTVGLAGKYVDTYAFADGGLEVRWQGLSLPYKVFDKDQRVTHAAIVENKRLGEVLAFIKSQQDARSSAAREDQQREERLPEDRAEAAGQAQAGRQADGTAAGRASVTLRETLTKHGRADTSALLQPADTSTWLQHSM